ncbi:MAG: hypothetical protein ACK5MT_20645 [Actinomycetales bacterium]
MAEFVRFHQLCELGLETSQATRFIVGLVVVALPRVDWSKAISVAAKTSLTLQFPNVDDVLGIIKPRR